MRLVKPTQRELEEAFANGPVQRAVVVSTDDAFALRAALMVRDVDPDVPHPRRAPALLRALLSPDDKSAALLLYGAAGILAILVLETVTAAIVLPQNIGTRSTAPPRRSSRSTRTRR